MDRRQLSSVADTRESNATSHPDTIGSLIDRTIAEVARRRYRELRPRLLDKKVRADKIATSLDELNPLLPTTRLTDDPWVALLFLAGCQPHHIATAASLCRRRLDSFDVPRMLTLHDTSAGACATFIGMAIVLAERQFATTFAFHAVEPNWHMTWLGEQLIVALRDNCNHQHAFHNKVFSVFANILHTSVNSIRYYYKLENMKRLECQSPDITIHSDDRSYLDTRHSDLSIPPYECTMITEWRRDVAAELNDYLCDKARATLMRPVLWPANAPLVDHPPMHLSQPRGFASRLGVPPPATAKSSARHRQPTSSTKTVSDDVTHLDQKAYKETVRHLLDRAIADVAKKEYDRIILAYDTIADDKIGNALDELELLRSDQHAPDYNTQAVPLLYLLRYQYRHVNLAATCFNYLLRKRRTVPNTIVDFGSGCLNALLGLVIAIGSAKNKSLSPRERPVDRHFIGIDPATPMTDCGVQLWERFRDLVNEQDDNRLCFLQHVLPSWQFVPLPSGDRLNDKLRNTSAPRWHTEFHAIDPINVNRLPESIGTSIDAKLVTIADTQAKRALFRRRNRANDELKKHFLKDAIWFFGKATMKKTEDVLERLAENHDRYQNQIKRYHSHRPHDPICYSDHHLPIDRIDSYAT